MNASPNSGKSSPRALSIQARKSILKMAHDAKSSHVASALSVVDILAVLYSGSAKISPDNLTAPDRDFVILSKGHAAAALYSILALQGFIRMEELETYCQNGAALGGHVTVTRNNGVELSTGSLGHGLPYGVGLALSQIKNKFNSRTFIVMSDGECDEGTTWEAALQAQHFGLSHLTVVIDRNKLQSIGNTEETIALEPLADKWKSFNWEVRVVDGHNHHDLHEAMKVSDKPLCIIANTTKGKGVSFMENLNLWHYKPPSDDDLAKAMAELEASKK